ncbi:MAG: SRPBCC family protein [Oligoflexus sp.]
MSKTIKTEITIQGGKEKVWQVLMDFENYSSWNPLIKKISGKAELGEKIYVKLQPPGLSEMVFEPTITGFQPGKRFAWLGKLWRKGLFDGEHCFEIEDMGKAIRFVQYESFSGILVPIILLFAGKQTRQGFEAMNEALKNKVEGLK